MFTFLASAPIFIPVPIRSHGEGTPMTLEIGLWTFYGTIALLRALFVTSDTFDTWDGPNLARSVAIGILRGLIWPIEFVVGLITGRKG
jgi:hypothetical protein